MRTLSAAAGVAGHALAIATLSHVGGDPVRLAYNDAAEKNAGVGVSYECFARRVWEIAAKYGYSQNTPEGTRFVRELHTADLLLAMGCSKADATAWTYFFERFRGLVAQQSLLLIKNRTNAEDLWAAALAHAVSPAGDGSVRIACFEGRSSLATWLRSLVRNLGLTYIQRQQVWSANEDAVDLRSANRLENSFRERRYASLIQEALTDACSALTARSHDVLILRYEYGLLLGDIARLLDVHESTVIRQIQNAIRTLRSRTFAFLYGRNMSRGAIKECIAELVENPAYSILQLLHERPAQIVSTPMPVNSRSRSIK